ncbi:MAG: hypothetical protein RIF32_19000 [Leptospirales bacterium]|jgi:hypothetical protein
MSESQVEHQDPAATTVEAPESSQEATEFGLEEYSAAELIKRMSPEAHDRLGSMLEGVASQMQGRTVNVTYANQKKAVRISKYASGLHTLFSAFDNEVRNLQSE